MKLDMSKIDFFVSHPMNYFPMEDVIFFNHIGRTFLKLLNADSSQVDTKILKDEMYIRQVLDNNQDSDLVKELLICIDPIDSIQHSIKLFESMSITKIPEQHRVITIKDFKKGDKAYILFENRGRNTKPDIRETEVISVGRKYVTVSNGWDRKYEDWDKEYLKENVLYGESTLLFKTRKAAEEYIEKMDLALWLGTISVIKAERQYSLEQLRKVKEILKD